MRTQSALLLATEPLLTVDKSQFDDRNVSYNYSQRQLHHVKSEADLPHHPKASFLPAIDTSVQSHLLSAAATSEHDLGETFFGASHTPSVAHVNTSYSYQHAPHQHEESPMSLYPLDPNWQRNVPLNAGINAFQSPGVELGQPSASSSATSAYPRSAAWPVSKSTAFPETIQEQSNTPAGDMTFIPYQPPPVRSMSGDTGSHMLAKAMPVMPQERISRRTTPLTDNSVRATAVLTPSPPPTADHDPLPRRGRRPVRKSASEQQLHDQQRQHQHQLQLYPVQPQRTRPRHRGSGSNATIESGPIRGVGREEFSRRKSSSAASTSPRGGGESPLQVPHFLVVVNTFQPASRVCPCVACTKPKTSLLLSFISPLSRALAHRLPCRLQTRPALKYQARYPCPRHFRQHQ